MYLLAIVAILYFVYKLNKKHSSGTRDGCARILINMVTHNNNLLIIYTYSITKLTFEKI